MSQDRSLVRASDIGLWAYCQRAWWLAKVKNVPHRNPAVLDFGDAAHAAHGAQVTRARTLWRVGLALLVLALVLTCILIFLWLVTG